MSKNPSILATLGTPAETALDAVPGRDASSSNGRKAAAEDRRPNRNGQCIACVGLVCVVRSWVRCFRSVSLVTVICCSYEPT
jgi:hypothetical protein